MTRAALGLLALLTIVLMPLVASAQFSAAADDTSAVTLPDPLTPEAVRELVSRLSDDQVRQLLLERLDAVAAGHRADAVDA